ncbi:MAG: glycosyltransferase family 4 protein [Elusimicrobiota bacterium]|nr:glycosyltransferase family 4 protein [Endomicrobiia bacterium]MDW8166458.1 glycosyltransferase family 4 protein [Elusimicrobiota bacterium]
MKILHISRQFYPCIGGTEKYIYEVAKRLIKNGFKNYVLTLNYNIFNKQQKFCKSEEIDGIIIYRVPGFGYYKKPIPLEIPLKLFKEVDIVHLHDIRFFFEIAIFLKNIYKYKLIYSTHGFLFHTTDFAFLKKLIIPVYYKPLIKRFIDVIVCVSQQDYEYFKELKNNVYLIENGIDYEKFSRIKREPIDGEFLYFGRIDKNKGLDILFNVLSKMKDLKWHLNIVGEGFDEVVNSLKNLAKNLGIDDRVIWWGFLSEEKLFELISKAHICFFPSTYEGFGFTLVEAMAAGCICVANKIKAYSSIILDNYNGFLVDFRDIEKTVSKIKKILKSSSSEISRQAKLYAIKYSWEEKIKMIESLYIS